MSSRSCAPRSSIRRTSAAVNSTTAAVAVTATLLKEKKTNKRKGRTSAAEDKKDEEDDVSAAVPAVAASSSSSASASSSSSSSSSSSKRLKSSSAASSAAVVSDAAAEANHGTRRSSRRRATENEENQDDKSVSDAVSASSSSSSSAAAAAVVLPPSPMFHQLPLVIVHHILDHMCIITLAQSVLPICHGWNNSIKKTYIPTVQSNRKRMIEFEGHNLANPFDLKKIHNPHPNHIVELKGSIRQLEPLCRSTLAVLVNELSISFHFEVGAIHLKYIRDSMPLLRVLSTTVQGSPFILPSHLHTLRIKIAFKNYHYVHHSRKERQMLVSKPPKPWSNDRKCTHIQDVLIAIANVSMLQSLYVTFSESYISNTRWDDWCLPLLTLSHLSTFHWHGSIAPKWSNNGFQLFRTLPSLTSVLDSQTDWNVHLPLLLKEPHELKLQEIVFNGNTLLYAPLCLQSLLSIKNSLTTLEPARFQIDVNDSMALTDLSTMLPQFVNLQRLKFNLLPTRNLPTASHESSCPNEIIQSITALPKLHTLYIGIPGLSSEQLLVVCQSIVHLTSLTVGSTRVTSLQCFSAVAHIKQQLTQLNINIPNIAPSEIVHLYELHQLTSLSISGSFSAPLFARQLLPFHVRSSMMPHLVEFVARSLKEPVPPEPVDLAAQSIAQQQFDSRIRVGNVCAAERMNAHQLSLVFQFCTTEEFSRSARSCRSWRNAASLPSCWSSGLESCRTLAVRDSPSATSANVLIPSILPSLPLFRYARSIQVTLGSSPHDAISTLALMTRMDSLHAMFTKSFVMDPLQPSFQSIGKRLLKGIFSGLPPRFIAFLTHIRELTFSNTQIATFPSDELLPLEQLRKLSLITCDLSSATGSALRYLSIHHQLRSVSITFQQPETMKYSYLAEYNKLRGAQTNEFMQALIGADVIAPTTAAVSSKPSGQFMFSTFDSTTAAPAPQASKSSTINATSQPAALEELIITHDKNYTSSCPFPFDLCFHLPHLIRLDLLRVRPLPGHSVSSTPQLVNLTSIGQLQVLPPLESLNITANVAVASLAHLSQLTKLKHVSISEPGIEYHMNGYDLRILPVGCITQLCTNCPDLESLSIHGYQIPSNEFGELSQLKKLIRLELYAQLSITLDVLAPVILQLKSSLRTLKLIQCANLHLLYLHELDWHTTGMKLDDMKSSAASMVTTVTPSNNSNHEVTRMEIDGEEEEKANASESVASAVAEPVSTSASASSAFSIRCILDLIRSCSNLIEFHWSPTYSSLQSSYQLVLNQTHIKRRGGSNGIISHQKQEQLMLREIARERLMLRLVQIERLEAIKRIQATQLAMDESIPLTSDSSTPTLFPLHIHVRHTYSAVIATNINPEFELNPTLLMQHIIQNTHSHSLTQPDPTAVDNSAVSINPLCASETWTHSDLSLIAQHSESELAAIAAANTAFDKPVSKKAKI